MKKPILTIIALFALTATAYADLPYGNFPYSDVSWDTQHAESIDYYPGSTFEGYPDGTFRPEQTLNRAELLKVLVVDAFGSDAILDEHHDDNCFKDVPAEEWFTKYVCFGKKWGIVEGYEDGTFRPTDDIILVEAVKMYAETERVSDEVYGQSYYKNISETEPWYKGYINEYDGLIPLDFTAFDQDVTRAQMTNFISNTTVDLGFMYQSTLFMFDNEISYETLSSGTNVEAIARSTDAIWEAEFQSVQDFEDPTGYQAVVYSSNAVLDTEEDNGISCSNGYYTGDFRMAIINPIDHAYDELVADISLGTLTLPEDPLHHKNFLLDPEDTLPLATWQYTEGEDEGALYTPFMILEQYGNCNFNRFTLYDPGNQFYESLGVVYLDHSYTYDSVFAESLESIEFGLGKFTHSYYDNSVGETFEDTYIYAADGRSYGGDNFVLES
jgi:hypothetical protein